MKYRDAVKQMLKEQHKSAWEVGRIIGLGDRSNVISNTLSNNNCNLETLRKVANALGYDIVLRRHHQGRMPEGDIVIDEVGKKDE